MRLFAHVDKDEGQVASPEAVFSWGKVYSWDPYNKRGNVVSHYFRFILPITLHKEYIDPSLFEKQVGPCRLWVIRLKHQKSGKVQWRYWWSPYL